MMYFNYGLTSSSSPSHGSNHVTLIDSFLWTVILAPGKIGLRRGDGVLIYIKSNITADVFEPVNKDNINALETLIVKCTFNNVAHFICGLYHPPKASYSDARLISHIDNISNLC